MPENIALQNKEETVEEAVITDSKLTPEEQIDFLRRKLEQAELEATDNRIALIEMTASRNALYKSLQDTQMRLAEAIGQRENDVEAYQKELDMRLSEKRQLQEQYDALVIKAKRYDELQESIVKIKMKAEVRAHGVIDEAQEKAMDTIMLIDNIEKEIMLFREDLTYLRRDIKIGTVTLDDRLENIYLRLCKNLDRLLEIKENFYIKNSLPLGDDNFKVAEGQAPTLTYPKPGEEKIPQEATETE
ncbi:MAG: hypothetical protein IJ861_08020 [Clostridia bacterium]|nr:hypothetical protein [Clostridia bacterium]